MNKKTFFGLEKHLNERGWMDFCEVSCELWKKTFENFEKI